MANSYKLKIVEKGVNTLAVNLRRTEIVEKEIGNLNDTTKIYDRCGRMYDILYISIQYKYTFKNIFFSFVVSNKENVLDKLKTNYKKLSTDLENQKDVKKKLEETVTEQTKAFNELARSIKN